MFARLMTASIALLVAAPAVSLAAVATTSYSAGDEGPNPRAVRIVEAEDGHLLTVNLADLEKGTRVHSARLRAARGKLEDAAGLLAEIEIFPGKAAAGHPAGGDVRGQAGGISSGRERAEGLSPRGTDLHHVVRSGPADHR